jgi:hypothetical protein
MASIFRGIDLRNGREVAIKVPHPEMEADPVLFDRFSARGDRRKAGSSRRDEGLRPRRTAAASTW